jgi:hypothetical protein
MMFTGCFNWKKIREIIGREQKMFSSMIFASNIYIVLSFRNWPHSVFKIFKCKSFHPLSIQCEKDGFLSFTISSASRNESDVEP